MLPRKANAGVTGAADAPRFMGSQLRFAAGPGGAHGSARAGPPPLAMARAATSRDPLSAQLYKSVVSPHFYLFFYRFFINSF